MARGSTQGQGTDIMSHTANPIAWSATKGLSASLQTVSRVSQILSWETGLSQEGLLASQQCELPLTSPETELELERPQSEGQRPPDDSHVRAPSWM